MRTKAYARLASIVLSVFAIHCASQENDPNADVDLAAATVLIAQPANTPTSAVPRSGGGDGGSPTGPVGPTDPDLIPDLFNLAPGTFVARDSMGTIDPVGTSLNQDFDGDGINNTDETTTNVWVADYPLVESTIATPVTMRIEILKDSTSSTSEIVSEITSDDMEDKKNEGTEKVHRNEINERTAQFQDSYSQTNEASGSTEGSTSGAVNAAFGGSVNPAGWAGGGSHSHSAGSSWSIKTGYSETKTKWKDVPFKNNLDRRARSVKSDSAARKARRYRTEKIGKVDENSIVEPDAGRVRAALYIKNVTTNLPVHMSNILASLMFETPQGDLIPIQSFRLRNEDYSLFEIDVYGGTEFGPYVVDLPNLNTVEVENAIAKGYVPKIFLVDYVLTHVPDSNYRSLLLNFSGENLKIIEENAKGRTALFKFIGPNMREMFRVTAFDDDGSDVCDHTGVSAVAPGISLRKAMERIGCGGYAMQFENYVLDLSEVVPGLVDNKAMITGIKSIGGIQTRIPCTETTETGSDGVARTACVMHPLSTWTEEEKETSGVWMVFANGKYYAHSEYLLDSSGNQVAFKSPLPGENLVPVLRGVDGTVWVGDQYDIVFVSTVDFLSSAESFGTNPLETGYPFDVNTRWDKNSVGSSPFDPDVHSKFLGQAGLGEKIQMVFDLKETLLLNPSFGSDVNAGLIPGEIYKDFSYNREVSSLRYNIDEAIDFEMSMALGGRPTDWFNITRDMGDPADDTVPASCGQTLDFVAQTFTLCVRLPRTHPNVISSDSPVHLYLRPALNNAYRNTVWPEAFDEVKKFKAAISESALTAESVIKVDSAIGTITAGDSLNIAGESVSFTVLSVALSGSEYTLGLSSGLTVDHAPNEEVSVDGSLTEAQYGFYIQPNEWTTWNSNVDPQWANNWSQVQDVALLDVDDISCGVFKPVKCLGYVAEFLTGNWVGNDNYSNPFWNEWADASNFSNFLSSAQRRWLWTKDAIREAEQNTFAGSFTASARHAHIQTQTAVPGKEEILMAYRSQTGPGLFARFFDSFSGSPLANEINLNGSVNSNYIKVAAAGSRALVIFDEFSSQTIRGRFIDLANRLADGSEFQIAATSPGILDMGVFGNSAVITYQSGIDIYVRVIDMSTGVMDPAVLISSPGAATAPKLAMDGDRAIVIYQWANAVLQPFTLRARVFNVTTGATEGADMSIYGVLSNGATYDVAVDADRAVITTRNANLTVTVVEPSTASVLSAHDFGPAISLNFPSIVVSNGRAIVAWGADHGDPNNWTIKYRFLDLSGVGTVGPEHNHVTGFVFPGAIGLYDERLLITWSNHNEGRLKGRFVDWHTGQAISGDHILVTRSGEGMGTAQLTLSGKSAFVSVSSGVIFSTFNIYGRVIPFPVDPNAVPEYGLNNFFVAPMMERTYSITAEIKE